MANRELEERRKIAESQIPRFLEFLKEVPGLQGKELEEHLSNLETQYIQRKNDWANQNQSALSPQPEETLIDCARRVLYKLNLYLPEGYITVIEKKEGRLVTEFRDRCPILDACQQLGLDTRIICRKVFHAPYQTVLSRVNPRLKFNRDYEHGLRPYHDCCVEIITVE